LGNDNPLFFKGYLLAGPQQNRSSFSCVLNVELLDRKGVVVKRGFHKVIDGMVEGYMQLPKKITPGKYRLKAYTRWMRNYGEDFFALEDILIGNLTSQEKEISKKSDIIILSEGGTLLNNHENKLIIKTPFSKVTNVGQVGKILDEKRKEVATVNYYSTGIGTSLFKPMKDKIYQIELENGDIYPIPKAVTQGYLLHVNNLDENSVKIRVTASSEVLGTSVTLVGTSGDIKYFENQLDFKGGNILDVDLSKKDIPYGVFLLRLVDAVGTELARRPIWVDRERLNIEIKPISSNNNEIAYKIKVTDKTNSPIKTTLALSANRYEIGTERMVKKYSTERLNLFTYPEPLEGNKISADRKNRFLKDLNLLVSDVSDKKISSIDNRFKNRIKYSIQKGLELTGYAYDLDNNLLDNTKIQVMAQTIDEIWFRETETDANGLLKLDDIQIIGSPELIFRTKGKDTKSRLVKIIPLKEWEKEKNNSFPKININQKKEDVNKITSLEPVNTKPSVLVDTTGLIELEEVEVSENHTKRQKYAPSVYGIDVPKTRIKYQDPKRPRSIAEMLSEIPGVAISGMGKIYPSVTIIRGSGPVLWVLDGFPLAQGDNGFSLGASVGSSLSEIMNLVSAIDVERIELLVGANASIYGSRGSGGVIAVYTRSGKKQEYISRKEGQLVFKGYEPLLEFGAYNQSLSKRTKKGANLLYWNPKLETNESGEAIIKIPILSHDSIIKIEASTITTDGKIGSLSVIFEE